MGNIGNAPENLSDFASIIRESIRTRGEAKGATLDDILERFDGDRVPALAFVREYGFEVKEIDGVQMVVERRHNDTP